MSEDFMVTCNSSKAVNQN